MSLFWTLLFIIVAFIVGFAAFVRLVIAPRQASAGGGYGARPAAPAPAEAAPGTAAAPPPAPDPAPPPPPEPMPEPAPEPAATSADGAEPGLPPAEGAPDDLKEISGVGPKLEQRLNALGITQFQQIAALTPNQIAWVDERLTFKGRIERDDWVGQAKALLQGG